jgi:DegV family protein with EDD domain
MTDVLTLQNTAIVLDSTCDAPEGFFDQEGVYLVPLRVHFGDETYRDRVDMGHEEFFAKLASTAILPTTSQPTVAKFATTYEEITATYEHVFSLHLSGLMSGTVRAAERAAQAFPGVEVYDTRTVSCGVALCAQRIRARLERGSTLEEIRGYIDYTIANTHLLFHAATLEYLRRGGRIGRAASLVGGVFDIKPLIQNADGTLAAYAKVRGQKKVLATMERFIEETTKPDDDVFYASIDAVNPEEAQMVRDLFARVRPNAKCLFHGMVGAVVGTHLGPGSAGFALIAE